MDNGQHTACQRAHGLKVVNIGLQSFYEALIRAGSAGGTTGLAPACGIEAGNRRSAGRLIVRREEKGHEFAG